MYNYINDNYKDTYITHSHSLTNAHTLNLQEVPANQPTKKRLSVHTFFFHMDIYMSAHIYRGSTRGDERLQVSWQLHFSIQQH